LKLVKDITSKWKNHSVYQPLMVTTRISKQALCNLKEFVEKNYGRKDILLTEVNVSFIDSYVLFLQTEKKCHQNGAMKQVQRLKKVVNIGLNYG